MKYSDIGWTGTGQKMRQDNEVTQSFKLPEKDMAAEGPQFITVLLRSNGGIRKDQPLFVFST